MAKRVILELRAPVNFTMNAAMNSDLARLPGFKIDPNYEPVPVNPPKEMIESMETANQKIFLIRGVVEDEKEEELKSSSNVLNVWSDARIEPS